MRQTRSDKKTRVNPGLDKETHEMLCRLSLACGLSKTKMAEFIIRMGVRNPDMVQVLQDIHKADQYRIIPATINGETRYIDGNLEKA